MLLRCLLVGRSRFGGCAARAVVAHVIGDDGVIHHDGFVHVNIGDAATDVHRGAVIEERVAAPFAAGESDAAESEAVVYAAIVSDVGAPVSSVEYIGAGVPTPVAGSPEHTLLRRGNPSSRNPVVSIVIAPRPKTGCPHIADLRANGLNIYGQRRRSHRD
jgi:hypothetical protein